MSVKKERQKMTDISVRIKELFSDNSFALIVNPKDTISDLKLLIEEKRKWRALRKAQTLSDKDEKVLKDHVSLQHYDITSNCTIYLHVNKKINYKLDRLDIRDSVRYHPSKLSQHDDDCMCGGFGPSKGICRDSWIWNCCGNFKERSAGCKWKTLTDLDKIKLKMEWLSDKYNASPLIAGYIRENVQHLNIMMDDLCQICFDFIKLETEYFHPKELSYGSYWCCYGKTGSIGCKSKWVHHEYESSIV